MSVLTDRIRWLEDSLVERLTITGARGYVGIVLRMAERYPPEAAETPHEARERHFSPDQRLAWTLRFGSQGEAEQAIAEAAAKEWNA